MTKALKIAGIALGSYLALDAAFVFGSAVMMNFYEGDWEIEPDKPVDKVLMKCIGAIDSIRQKYLI